MKKAGELVKRDLFKKQLEKDLKDAKNILNSFLIVFQNSILSDKEFKEIVDLKENVIGKYIKLVNEKKSNYCNELQKIKNFKSLLELKDLTLAIRGSCPSNYTKAMRNTLLPKWRERFSTTSTIDLYDAKDYKDLILMSKDREFGSTNDDLYFIFDSSIGYVIIPAHRKFGVFVSESKIIGDNGFFFEEGIYCHDRYYFASVESVYNGANSKYDGWQYVKKDIIYDVFVNEISDGGEDSFDLSEIDKESFQEWMKNLYKEDYKKWFDVKNSQLSRNFTLSVNVGPTFGPQSYAVKDPRELLFKKNQHQFLKTLDPSESAFKFLEKNMHLILPENA